MNRSLVVFIILLFATVTMIPANAAPDDDPVQRNALTALFISTNGPLWYDYDGWGGSSTYCSWHGVACSVRDVIELGLQANNLNGPLPPEIGNLINLRELDLSRNNLSGSIPPELGSLSGLQRLDFEFNNLSGPIPPELGNLINLQYFILGFNDLSGPIPSTLGDLTGLYYLLLNDNQLTGPLPPELGQNPDVSEVINLSNNELSGPIPSEFGNMTDLIELYLNGNNLSGAIPSALTNLGWIQVLNLSDNPELTCWETLAALIWALGRQNYEGPETVCGGISYSWLPAVSG